MALFCNCKGEVKQLKAELAAVETNIASLRGLINAKLGTGSLRKGMKNTSSRSRVAENDDEYGEYEDGELPNISDLPAEFVQGLSPEELGSLKNLLRR